MKQIGRGWLWAFWVFTAMTAAPACLHGQVNPTNVLRQRAAEAEKSAAEAAQAQASAAVGEQQFWTVDYNYFDERQGDGDDAEWLIVGGIRLRQGDVEIRGAHAVLLVDRDEQQRSLARIQGSPTLPRRGMPQPNPRRQTTTTAIEARLRAFLATAAPSAIPSVSAANNESWEGRRELRFFKHLYLEGGVTVTRGNRIAIEAERLWISPIDDRLIVENGLVRYVSAAGQGRTVTYTVRGPRLVKQGTRLIGREVSVTSCPAGEPQFEIFTGEVQVIDRPTAQGESEFEIISRGNTLAVGGTSLLPLPNVRFFTKDQNEVPLKGGSAGYSNREGFEANLDFGGPANGLGSGIHEFLTGRPGSEFRGNWELGLGYIEERGFPIRGALDYQGGTLWRGRTEVFHLDDRGENIRYVQNRVDGSLIDDTGRNLVRSKNRFQLGDHTRLDAALFATSDEATYSEFFERDYFEDELPETNLYLRSAGDQSLFTASGRFNLNDFGYNDSRALTPFFVEELPFATYDVFSYPIAETPWETPITLSASTGLGRKRLKYDDRFTGTRVADDVTRFDQEIELAAPVFLGPVGIRPFASARFTHFNETALSTSSEGRWALAAGAVAGTRMQRTFSWLDADGDSQSLRHVMAPAVRFLNRYQVEGDPSDFLPIDEVDLLDERTEIRFELNNRLQRMKAQADSGWNGEGPIEDGQTPGLVLAQDFLQIDLAQTILPNAARDNAGEELGLLEYEVVLRPDSPWAPLPDMRLYVDGEHDWSTGQLRTFNTELGFGPIAGFNYYVDYRTDRAVDGTIGYGAVTSAFGRWSLIGGAQYDLGLRKHLNYNALLVRSSLNWNLELRISFDNIGNETRFMLNFEPKLGGLFRNRRAPKYLGGRQSYGTGSITDF